MSGRPARITLRALLVAALAVVGLAAPAHASGFGVGDSVVVATGEQLSDIDVLSNDIAAGAPADATIELVNPPAWASTFDGLTVFVDLSGEATTSGSLTVDYNVLDSSAVVVGTATLTVYVVH